MTPLIIILLAIIGIAVINFLIYITFIYSLKKYDIKSLRFTDDRDREKYHIKYFEDKYKNTMKISFNKQKKQYSMDYDFYTKNISFIIIVNKLIHKKLDYMFNNIK